MARVRRSRKRARRPRRRNVRRRLRSSRRRRMRGGLGHVGQRPYAGARQSIRKRFYASATDLDVGGSLLLNGAGTVATPSVTLGTSGILIGNLASFQYISGLLFFRGTVARNFGAYANIFDAFRIDRVHVVWTPMYQGLSNPSSISAYNGTTVMPFPVAQTNAWVHECRDYNDVTLFSANSPGIQAIATAPSYRRRELASQRPGSTVQSVYRPKQSILTTGTPASTLATASQTQNFGWMNVMQASSGVGLGYKFILELYTNAATAQSTNHLYLVRLDVFFDVTFRGQAMYSSLDFNSVGGPKLNLGPMAPTDDPIFPPTGHDPADDET